MCGCVHSMKERNLQAQCMLEASKRHLLCYHFEAVNVRLPSGGYKRSGVPVGWPDLIIICPRTSKTMYAELKVKYNTTSNAQDTLLDVLPNAYVIRDIKTFIQHLDATFD